MNVISLFTVYLLLLTLSLSAASAPIEVWLTPERRAELSRISARPAIIKQERLDAQTVVYHWTNNPAGSVITQRVQSVFGKPAKNAWKDRLDAKEREKQAILDDVKAIKDKPTKANLDAVLKKHAK